MGDQGVTGLRDRLIQKAQRWRRLLMEPSWSGRKDAIPTATRTGKVLTNCHAECKALLSSLVHVVLEVTNPYKSVYWILVLMFLNIWYLRLSKYLVYICLYFLYHSGIAYSFYFFLVEQTMLSSYILILHDPRECSGGALHIDWVRCAGEGRHLGSSRCQCTVGTCWYAIHFQTNPPI